MRGRQCYDCLNERRRADFAHDPATRARRQAQRDHTREDPDRRSDRQRRYRSRLQHELRVPLHLPQAHHSPQETLPVILPDWFWYVMGRRVFGSQYDRSRVNPSSYDTRLDAQLRLQRYRGTEYPDTPAELYRERGVVGMRFRDPVTGARRDVNLQTHPFQPGDSVLARTAEHFRLPRFVRLQGMLKSSPAREGIDSRSALYIDPQFHGTVTLELHFDRSGYLIPGEPLVQFEAQLCLSLRPYRGHYVGQQGVTSNRNSLVAFRSTVE